MSLCLMRNMKTKLNMTRQSSDMAKFRKVLKSAKSVVFLTGAGISAESGFQNTILEIINESRIQKYITVRNAGIPTFRGEGGLWRKYDATILASPITFRDDPGLVWEFYHYRREIALKAKPNAGHLAIAQYEKRHSSNKNVTVLTQNVDGLHAKAGTKNLIELHGSLFKTRCMKCGEVLVNMDSPICEGLRNKGVPDPKIISDIHEKDLPRCKKSDCGGLLRPHIVWFGETLELAVIDRAGTAMDKCDVCLVIGTSSLVYPVALYAPFAAIRGAIVAEFNLGETPHTRDFQFHFDGPSSKTIPQALAE